MLHTDDAALRARIILLLTLVLACPFAAFPQAPPPVWGTPANLFGAISAYGIELSLPAIDGQGNAWVVLDLQSAYNSPTTVSIVKSVGTTGAWNAPQVIYTISAGVPGQCFPVVADIAGNVTVFCSLYEPSGVTEVVALRYSVTGGWLAPVTLYQGPQPYNVLAVTDANGDIVLVLGGTSLSANTDAACYIYSAAAQQWLRPVGIAPVTDKGAALDYTLGVTGPAPRSSSSTWTKQAVRPAFTGSVSTSPHSPGDRPNSSRGVPERMFELRPAAMVNFHWRWIARERPAFSSISSAQVFTLAMCG